MQSGDWDWPLHSFPAYLQSSDDWTHSIDEAIRGISGDRAAATTARAERDRRLWQAVRSAHCIARHSHVEECSTHDSVHCSVNI